MRVDDLALLLQVEGLLVRFDLRLRQLFVVILSIVREESFGVRIAHETVSAASHSRAVVLIPSRQRVVYKWYKQQIGQTSRARVLRPHEAHREVDR